MTCDTPDAMAASIASLWACRRDTKHQLVSFKNTTELGRKERKRTDVESMPVLNRGIRDQVQRLDSVESVSERVRIIVIGLSDINSCVRIAGKPLG